MCSKIRFESKKDAKRAMRRFQSHAGCEVRRVYRCDACGGYHLTSQTLAVREQRLAEVRELAGAGVVG